MLDDRERAMLLDIENHLVADDPWWSTAFSTYAWRARRQRTFEMAFHAVAVVVCAALALLMVVADAPGPAVFFAAVAGLSVVAPAPAPDGRRCWAPVPARTGDAARASRS